MKFFERIGPNGELFAPTISPAIEYDADQDAEILRDAMSGVGTNEEDIISIFTNRNYEQRKAIESAYESSFGRSLQDDIKSEVNGHLEVALLALLMSPGEIRAEACHEALSGGGTDEVSLARIIGSATNDEIEDMKESYLRLYDKDLIEAINGDCSGDFSRILIALLQANRIEPSEEQMRAFETDGISALVDYERAEELQHKLYEAGDGAWGTDEDTFIMILCRQSVWMIAAIDHYYQQKVSKSIIEAIESEFGGDEENILKNIVQGSLDRPMLYAKLLHDTMKRVGTNEKALIQLITMRAEIDLQTIKEVYETKYEESLLERVKSEVSGDLENILTALIEP